MNLRGAIPSNALRFNQEYTVDSSSLCVRAFERAKGDDSERVDVLMRPEIMRFDVMPVACFSNSGKVKDSLDKGLKIWIIDNASEIAFEMESRNSLDFLTNLPESNAFVQAPACSSVGFMSQRLIGL